MSRPLPQSIESEQAVIGGLLLKPDAYDDVMEIVQASDFYSLPHRVIFKAIGFMREHGRPVDAVTLAEFMVARGMAEQISNGAYLVELASTTPSAANIVAYAESVKEKSLQRQVIEAGLAIQTLGYNEDALETHEILSEAMERVFQLARKEERSGIETGKEGLMRTVEELRRIASLDGSLLGYETGIEKLDDMLSGFQAPDLIVIAARPGMGKTAFMQQISRRNAQQGHRPLRVSMEMTGPQLYMRDIAAEARVDYDKVKTASYDAEEAERVQKAIARMQEWEWFTDDTNSLTPRRLAARIRRLKRQHDIGIVYIDYLQIMDLGRLVKEFGTMTLAISETTRMLKSLAKELKIPIVLLSQLNRSVEQRADKRPMMSDLRESGAIEQDADVVLLLYREAYYNRHMPSYDAKQDVIEVIVGKARAARTGTVPALFRGNQQRFENLTNQDVWAVQQERHERKQSGGVFRRTYPGAGGFTREPREPDAG